MKSHLASHRDDTDQVADPVTAQATSPVTGEVTGQVEAQASLIPTEIFGEQLPKLLDKLNEVFAA